MPVQLRRASALSRLFAASAALLIAVQLVIAPAAAAPGLEDDEWIMAPLSQEDVTADEPVHEADEEAVAPAPDEDEPDAEPTDAVDEAATEPADAADEAAAEPAHEEDEATAEPVQVVDEPADLPAADDRPIVAVAPADDPVADPFLMRLLDAINERRHRNGTRPLSFVPARANAALESFFARTVAGLGWPGPCTHDLGNGAPSWDVVVAAGFGGAPRGEVLACPGPEPYWTPDRTAEQWWDSPIHFGILYADGDSNSIACSAQGVQGGSHEDGKKKRKGGGSPEAASAIICVTFQS